MPADINTVALVGRLTAKPELKGANNNVLPLRLAFTSRQKVGDDWTDVSNYVDAVIYGRQAEVLAGMLDKGSRVGITGELRYQEWQAQDGSKRSRVQVQVRDCQLLSQDKPKGAPAGESPARKIVEDLKQNFGGEEVNDDDIPF
jgi:single-strand DNA-binding protein